MLRFSAPFAFSASPRKLFANRTGNYASFFKSPSLSANFT